MSVMASQITNVSTVYTLFRLKTKRSLKFRLIGPFVRGIHGLPGNLHASGAMDSPHKGPVIQKVFRCYDVIMELTAENVDRAGHRQILVHTAQVTASETSLYPAGIEQFFHLYSLALQRCGCDLKMWFNVKHALATNWCLVTLLSMKLLSGDSRQGFIGAFEHDLNKSLSR